MTLCCLLSHMCYTVLDFAYTVSALLDPHVNRRDNKENNVKASKLYCECKAQSHTILVIHVTQTHIWGGLVGSVLYYHRLGDNFAFFPK
jgi:hypothetical protein